MGHAGHKGSDGDKGKKSNNLKKKLIILIVNSLFVEFIFKVSVD